MRRELPRRIYALRCRTCGYEETCRDLRAVKIQAKRHNRYASTFSDHDVVYASYAQVSSVASLKESKGT